MKLSRKKFLLIMTCIGLLLMAWFVPFFLKQSKSLETHFHDLTWDRHIIMDPLGRIELKWNFTDEDVTMMVTAATTGYVGIGFSLKSDMTDADFIIGWIRNDKIHLYDYYATGNSHPTLDTQQDVKLLFGKENGTHTILYFKRKLNTCDKQDLKLTNSTVYGVWCLHDLDPEDNSNLYSLYYDGNRGAIPMHFLDMEYPPPSLEELDYLDIGANRASNFVKKSEHYYWCKFVKIPNFGEKRHFVGYVPLIQPEHVHLVHHILLYECAGYDLDRYYSNDDGHKCFLAWNLLKETACRREIVSWAIGSKGEFLPQHIGYPFGSTDEKPHYIMVQIHYSYKQYIKDFEDSSKIRLFHTKHLRRNEASTMSIKAKHFQIIPINQVDFPTTGICSPSCTQNFPTTGIHAFRYLFHGHTAVRKLRLHHFRNGTEINSISDDNFIFNFQQARFFKNEIVILPNDSLAVECLHDSRNRTETITTGLDSKEEMCLIIIQYYPPVDLVLCSSVLKPDIIKNVLGYYYFSEKDIAELFLNPYVYGPYYSAMTMYIKYVSLTNKQADELRKLYLEGKQLSECLNDTTLLEHNIYQIVSYSDGKLLEERDQCQVNVDS